MGDFRTTTGEPLPPPARQRRAKLRRRLLLILLAIAGIGAAGLYYRVDRYVPAVGYVTTEEYAEVRPPVSGIVADIVVETGQNVQQGDLLVQLDNSQQIASLEEAKAQLSKVRAEAARRRIEITETKRKLTEDAAVAKLRLESAVRKLERTKELFAKGLVSGSQLEDLELQRDLAEAELNSMLNRDITLFDRELEVIEQGVNAREDGVRLAELRVASRQILAPIAGQILRYEFVIGELVRPETILVEIFGGDRQVLRLKVAERYAALAAEGQRYTAVLGPYRGHNTIIFEGVVERLRNVIEGDAERTYRVAYCTFDGRGMAVPPGTTAEARVYYGDSNLWSYLFGLR